MEVLVFRTSLSPEGVQRVAGFLNTKPGIRQWNVDLDDWEKVLRVESTGITEDEIIDLFLKEGIFCQELDG